MITDALIIRENNQVGESGRYVTALTAGRGVVHIAAYGARSLKSRRGTATSLLAYSRLSLRPGKGDTYILDDAEPLRMFFDLNKDILRLTLAQYICELAGVLAPKEEPAEEFLRLALNALHLLCGGRDPRLVKAAVELRMLSLAGFMPDLAGCASCSRPAEEANGAAGVALLPREGTLLCAGCRAAGSAGGVELSPSVLAAMRHITGSPFEKCFSFSMSGPGLDALAGAADIYARAQMGRGFKTLDVYYSLAGPPTHG